MCEQHLVWEGWGTWIQQCVHLPVGWPCCAVDTRLASTVPAQIEAAWWDGVGVYGFTNMWIHFYICVHPWGLCCVFIDSRCRKHWPCLRAVSDCEQTHMRDFFSMYVSVCIII